MSVLLVALPIPGKCFAVAATCASASPRANGGHRPPNNRPGRAEGPVVGGHERACARDVGHRGEIDGDPSGAERPAGEERLTPDARRARPAELASRSRPARPTAGGGRVLPPGRSRSGAAAGPRPGPRACSSRVSGSELGRARDVEAEEDDPPISPRRMRPRSAGDGRVPRIATMSRWPTSSRRRGRRRCRGRARGGRVVGPGDRDRRCSQGGSERKRKESVGRRHAWRESASSGVGGISCDSEPAPSSIHLRSPTHVGAAAWAGLSSPAAAGSASSDS